MNSNLLQIFLEEIKSKSQISGLENEYILERLNKFFLTNGKLRKKIEEEFVNKKGKIVKSKIFKEVIKAIRAQIGEVYGQFLTKDFGKKYKLLERKEIAEILKCHKSTRERIDFYDEIYSKIFDWYSPKIIGDLACGLNPVSYDLMNIKAKYFASDLNPEDMEFLKKFFDTQKIEGVAKAYDIVNLKVLEDKDFMKCDLVFLFKALDSFEEIKRGISKELLEGISAKRIVVSFPTKSLVSRENFKNTHKGWLRKIIDENKWNYETFEVENEVFFLIKKD